MIRRLVYQVADGCERVVPDGWLWVDGRRVKLLDGTTLTMPDTLDNQAAYPQSSAQRPGLGYPILRMVVLLSLATGMVSGMALGPYSGKETGETALFRELFDRLQAGDVVLGDRYYCSYFMICLLRELGVDVVTRLHQKRTADFRRGKRLGPGDHVVTWDRPARPAWMAVRQFGAEEAMGDQGFVDAAQPVERQVPQAAAHRIADQERAGEHRRAGHDAQGHGKIHAPVVQEAGED